MLLLLPAQSSRAAGVAAATAGADGVVAKEGSSQQLVNAIRRVVDGKQAMVAGRRSRLLHDHGMESLGLWTLSERELEVLGLLAHGWSNRRIAQAWHASLATVRTHVQNLLEKLDLHTKLEAAAFAWEHGIVAGDGMASGDASLQPI